MKLRWVAFESGGRGLYQLRREANLLGSSTVYSISNVFGRPFSVWHDIEKVAEFDTLEEAKDFCEVSYQVGAHK